MVILNLIANSTQLIVLCAVLAISAGTIRSAHAELHVDPAVVTLDGPETTQQLLVSLRQADALSIDLTRRARYEIVDPQIARIDETGLVEPRSEGQTQIVVHHEGQETRVTLNVRGINAPVPVSFDQQIIPLLTKSGCNSGGCHGKAEGQNGFKLSIFGFDPEADYQSLVMESRGRRVVHAVPEQSLLYVKATSRVPHGGGLRIVDGSLSARRLSRWIEEGTPYTSNSVPRVTAIEVEPSHQVLSARGFQQLRVIAIDEAGGHYCVTAEAEFESNAVSVANVDRRGGIQADENPGEAAILARYLGHVAVCRITIPRPGVTFIRPAEANFIDGHVWNKLEHLGIPPSDLADDATFIRRVFFDTIGTLPTSAEARRFLASTDPNKRSALIQELLRRPEYADFWTMRWSDLLRVDRDAVTAQGAIAMTNWLRRQIAENRPYDQFVQEIVTAQGDTTADGPAAFYKALGTPEIMSRSISQIFLGVRIECAQCHHHPSEKWGQDDYFALAGFFTGVTRKNLPSGLEAIVVRAGTDLPHPRTGQAVPAHALGVPAAVFSAGDDRRTELARWMTTRNNPFFAKALVNRLWSHYFGRGLVEPIDDLRATNPATNEPLFDELAAQFEAGNYDLKAFTATLLNSRTYQLGAATLENVRDDQNFSHANSKALSAEVLLDAICQTTGVPEKFNGWPEGARSIQVWDNRMPSYFLKLFGRPVRATVCECERSNEPSIAQALHLMNSPEVMTKVRSRKGVVYQLAKSTKPSSDVIDELYLATLTRYPTAKERSIVQPLFEESPIARRAAAEDILWALLNTKEFVFNH